jgi:hypothetical protein
VVKFMGGAWASANLGKDYDAFRGIAKKGDPSEWCRRFRFPQSAHFALGKYGEAGASRLANAWCDRLNYFYAIMQESDKPADFNYTQELADQYLVMERGEIIAQGPGSEMQSKNIRQLVSI